MSLSVHVYCVAIAFKMTEWAKNEYTSHFALSFNISLWKLFRWFRRPQLWATGDWQLHHNNAPAHASHLMQSFLVKHQITQVTQPSYSPDLVPCDFWLFPKLKSPLKWKRFQTISEIQENTMGQLMAIRRTVWGPKVPTLKGTEASLSYVQCFLYLVSSSVSVSIFIFHGWIPSGQALYMCVYVYTLYTYIFSWQRNHFMLLSICAHFSLGRLVLHGTKWKQ